MSSTRNRIGMVAAFLVCTGGLAVSGQTPAVPPEVVFAPGMQYPIRSVADGIVVLDVMLDDKGTVRGTTVVRDIPSLTDLAVSSIRAWKFKPASANGEAQSSVMRVVCVFRPPAYLAAGPSFGPVTSSPKSSSPGSVYVPAGILSVAPYPTYPINAAMAGAVVVQVAISRGGVIGGVRVIRDLQPFTSLAVNAVKKWRFQPATRDGRPEASNVAVVFVFAPLPAGI